jgi:hypothetical protein
MLYQVALLHDKGLGLNCCQLLPVTGLTTLPLPLAQLTAHASDHRASWPTLPPWLLVNNLL